MGEQLLKCSTNYTALFGQLLEDGSFVDCTLAAEGRYLKAHKAVLAAASVYFKLLFTQEDERDPFIIFTDIRYNALEAVVNFIYRGEVEILEDGLGGFLNAAMLLQIGGLDHNKLVVRKGTLPTCDRDSSQILPVIDYGSITSVPPCDENILKSEFGDSERSSICSTGEPPSEYEFSTLVSDIEIKEPDEEIYSDVMVETDDRTVRMENECSSVDECTLEDLNAKSDTEVSPGQHDANLRTADSVVHCEHPVTHIGNADETFKCQSCNFETTQEVPFNEHINSHLLESTIQLSHCTLSNMEKATKNRQLQNQKGKPFKCSCTTALKSMNYIQNQIGENSFTSVQTKSSCTCKKDLVPHTSSNIKEKPYKCVHCTFTCTRKIILIKHMLTHREEKSYECTQCTYSSIYRTNFINHTRTHTGEKPFKCTQCSFAAGRKSFLKAHMRTHTEEKPFKCEQCTFACRHKGTLESHLRMHSGEKPFKCPQCTFAAGRKYTLKTHMRTHTEEKPFKCEQCTFACRHKGTLESHLRRHSGEKPFKCPHCTFSCRQKGSLVLHLRTHTKEKPFECTHCSYACSYKSNLKIHLLMHSGEKPFKCTDCTYACRQKRDLVVHLRTHTKEKPFKCTQCTYASREKYCLKSHLLTHTEEKPFKCTQCTYAANRATSLKTHMRMHTEEKPFKQCTGPSSKSNAVTPAGKRLI